MKRGEVEALNEQSQGQWLVETLSGSRHVIDLTAMTYSRQAGDRQIGHGLDEGAVHPMLEIEQWPRINSTFRLMIDDGEDDVSITSSFVTRVSRVDGAVPDLPLQTVTEEVCGAPPINAWLVIGDDGSFPTEEELVDQRDPADPDLWMWTVPKQIQRGDLVFLYFMSPRKSVHFVARALFPPIFDPSIEVNSTRDVNPNQWWTELSPFVPVRPIPYRTLLDLHDGQLVLRGGPTNYLTPPIVGQLIAALGDLDDEQQLVLQLPVGNPALPRPDDIDVESLRTMASGPLRLEAQVEEYVVEPLLRLCFGSTDVSSRKRVKLPGVGVPDYGLYRNENLIGVVEVKLGVQRRRNGDLSDSPDLAQILKYMRATDAPGMLIDANAICLLDRDDSVPYVQYDRTGMTESQLEIIAGHFDEEPDQT